MLTFFVGASIVISLVGRGQIAKKDHSLSSPVDYIKQDRDAQWEALEREEKERLKNLAAQEAGEEDDNDKAKEEDDSEGGEEAQKSNDKEAKKEDKKEEKN